MGGVELKVNTTNGVERSGKAAELVERQVMVSAGKMDVRKEAEEEGNEGDGGEGVWY